MLTPLEKIGLDDGEVYLGLEGKEETLFAQRVSGLINEMSQIF